MRRILILALTGLAVLCTPAFADWPSHPHDARCAWPTSGTFYSSYYGEWMFYNGHLVIGGKYYRRFNDYSGTGNGTFLGNSYVYCG